MLSELSFRFPLGRLGLAIFLLFLIGLGLTLELRGTLNRTTIQIVGSPNLPSSIDAELASGTSTGYIENFSNWDLQIDPSVVIQTLTHNVSGFDLDGSFLHA